MHGGLTGRGVFTITSPFSKYTGGLRYAGDTPKSGEVNGNRRAEVGIAVAAFAGDRGPVGSCYERGSFTWVSFGLIGAMLEAFGFCWGLLEPVCGPSSRPSIREGGYVEQHWAILVAIAPGVGKVLDWH